MVDLVEVRGAGGGLPTVGELDPYQLKATPSEFGDSSTYGMRDPYVPRTHAMVDQRVRAALAGARLVLLIGPSKAGKTRTLFEALRCELPHALVVVPDRSTLADVAGCREYQDAAEMIVVWLENVDEFLTAERALTPRMLAMLTARRARTVVVGTLRSERYHELNIEGELARDIRAVLEQSSRIELEPTSASPVEQATAGQLYPGLDLSRHGVAEMLVGAPALLAYYRRGYTAARVAPQVVAFTTVVEVVIDWVRVGRPDRIPESRVLDLARKVIDTRHSGYDISDRDLTEAIAQARLPITGAGATSAIDSTWLTGSRTRGYRPFDYLLAADDDRQQRPPRPIPDFFWREAIQNAPPAIRFAVAYSAALRDKHQIAYDLWKQLADSGSISAMNNLGQLLRQRGDLGEAERWWRKAVDGGDIEAMRNLGILFARRNDLSSAEPLLRRSAEAGDITAMNNLGQLLRQRGDLGEAESWWRKAIDVGDDAEAMDNLWRLLHKRGDSAGTEAWMRAAAEAGHADSMHVFGFECMERGDLVEAEDWYRKAIDAGSVKALFSLGLLLQKRGDTAEAETWYSQAADAGDIDAMRNLGLLLERRGELPKAENWYSKAAAAGHVAAMVNLGHVVYSRGDLAGAETWWHKAAEAGGSDLVYELANLLWKRGDHGAAETWYRKAAATGHTDAMNTVGALHFQRGDAAGAEVWFRKATEAGHPDPMFNVGVISYQRGDLEKAEQWWRKAAEIGHVQAMLNLGSMLAERDDLAGAEAWFRMAAETGHPQAMCGLGALLAERGDLDGAEMWFGMAAEIGHAEAMHNLGELFDERGDVAEAEKWWRKASEAGYQGA
ncbi:tetratricopeptide repeat protein [Nocardia amamiensis]|uniref:Tetratricopeptide repeat protein n=1 Tax=Nocardia amamiensis TaxID=404578 RepID=A0ABS0D210_9NOCA|nr:tetratricopeptide repeat protein [Nocardia amamiensis]MBF6302681.1 tetratricopeptide repeat protein [Nocardia amamiensis]